MKILHQTVAAQSAYAIKALTMKTLGGGSAAAIMAGMSYSRYAPQITFDAENGGGSGSLDVATLAAQIKAEQARAVDAVKAIAEEALGKAKNGETLTGNLKATADEALVKMNTLTEQVAQLEQKLSRGGDDEGNKAKSFGEQFTESEAFKSWADGGFSKNARGADIKLKATLTTATTDAAGSMGAGVPTTRLPGMVELPQRRMTIRNLITPGQMSGNTLEYVREKAFTNAADMVAEGAAKPDSDLQSELITTSAKVIAHWMKASKQVLDDVPMLRSMIDQRLQYGLALKEEQQLLNGNNVGQNLHGILPQATAFSAPISLADINMFDVLRLAILQAALTEYVATGHVLHPTDWAAMEMTKDDLGRYIIGNPQGNAAPSLWGLPVVATQAIGSRKFLTGAFQQGAQLFDRWESRIEVGYVNDDFTKNLVTILGEERLALAVYRPDAFITGDLDAALAA